MTQAPPRGEDRAPLSDVPSSGISDAAVREPASVVPGRRSRARRMHHVQRALVIAALTVFAVAFAYPFVWLVSASFKPRGEVFDNRLIPQTFTFENYLEVWQEAPLALWLVNTLLVTALGAVAVTLSSAMVAWGFAHFRFRGREALFWLVLATMMLPGAVTMIPTFLIWNALGFVGTLVPLWAGNLFASAFYVFLLRQFMLGLPRELFDAARVDGASQWGVFWRVALPLTKPALAVTLVFEVQALWTDLMRALIYLRDSAGVGLSAPHGGVECSFAEDMPRLRDQRDSLVGDCRGGDTS